MNLRNEKALQDFEQAARHFCSLLETDPVDKNEWLKKVLAALASLYANAHQIPDYGLPENAVEPPKNYDVSDEEYAAVTKRVSRILGERSKYWTYFDPTITNDPAEKPIAGALWDDLGDIYRDVKPGLNAWATGRDEYLHSTAFDWRWPLFEVHWGRHALDAMRALHQLAFDQGI
jgi:hypothetical protein